MVSSGPPAGDTVDPLIGRVVGGCELVRLVGQGGMGAVYLARQVSLERDIVVKILHSDLVRQSQFVRRFDLEAKAAAQLTHPNIVQVLDYGCEDSLYYILMEYVRGVTIKEMIQARGTIPLDRALQVVRETARGLGAAHRAGIIHRDVKPANIMISQDEIVKVADFGIAKTMEPGAESLTQTNFLVGTVQYMSPEQCEGKDLDGRADIYSLGITFYQMLTGRRPFEGKSTVDLMRRHIYDAPPPVEQYGDAVPAELSRILFRMLAKDRGDRYPSCEALIADVLAFQKVREVVSDEPTLELVSPTGLAPSSTTPQRGDTTATLARKKSIDDDRSKPSPDPVRSGGGGAGGVLLVVILCLLAGGGTAWWRWGGPWPWESPDPSHDPGAADRLRDLEVALAGIDNQEEKIDWLIEFLEEGGSDEAARRARSLLAKWAPSAEEFAEEARSWFEDGAHGSALEVVSVARLAHPTDEPLLDIQRSIEAAIEEGLVFVEGGTYVIGDDADPISSPQHEEEVKEFYIGRYEVSNAEFLRFTRSTGTPAPWPDDRIPEGQEDHPVTGVTLQEAQAYCRWRGCRLPTEVEWEAAARGKTGRLYPWGDQFDPGRAVTGIGGASATVAVAAKPESASPCGAEQMVGNVWEWTTGIYRKYPGGDWGRYQEREGLTVARGGGIGYFERQEIRDTPRASSRLGLPGKRTSRIVGFRCAWDGPRDP